MARSLAIVCRNLLREPNALLSIDRFELVRTLGRGGNGVVYEAFDPVRRETVALKVLYERGPSYLYRLKREFRVLAELRHPNLVALHELSVGPDEAHFTMELVEGCDLLSYTANAVLHARAPEACIRDALAQLCEGVHALHLAGKLHRDLKPSNVLVTAAGRVVLLDFGLAGETGGAASKAEGTLAFMAPEQARGAACEASDWYSIGCALQRVLATSAAHAAAMDDPFAVAGLRALAPLAARLMSPEPSERPGFAELSACVRGQLSSRASRPAASAPPPASARFVAREAELSQLDAALSRSRKQPVFVLVRGESG
ncbi:MAG TPA: serine/threonine-protein kinase, partial [Polyangiales bacterium]|nr:serine/threonine-protein kinase [Polyangiales bacterium]